MGSTPTRRITAVIPPSPDPEHIPAGEDEQRAGWRMAKYRKAYRRITGRDI